MAKYHIKVPRMQTTISNIIAQIGIFGNNSLPQSSSSMLDFNLLKSFKVNLHPPWAFTVKEVIWRPLIINWLKCISDRLFESQSSGCGCIFRYSKGNFIIGLPEPTSSNNSLHAKKKIVKLKNKIN